MLEIVAMVKEILPETIAIQIPPNLIDDRHLLLECLKLGATDLGGIVPKDEVNPDYHHDLTNLQEKLNYSGYQLQSRLPVYSQYYSWLSNDLQSKVFQIP